MTARLNVNIDHVATVRQARRAPEPSVVAAAMMCEEAGADGITVHLRGDRRHIQDEDLYALRRTVTTYLNVEMAATDEMIAVATDARPDAVTLVAENPGEITTEGGLDAAANFDLVRETVDRLLGGARHPPNSAVQHRPQHRRARRPDRTRRSRPRDAREDSRSEGVGTPTAGEFCRFSRKLARLTCKTPRCRHFFRGRERDSCARNRDTWLKYRDTSF